MGTVNVDGVNYTVYNTDALAVENYLKASTNPGRDAFLAFTSDDDKARVIVQARRLIDRQAYEGQKTSGAQALAFPRTGLVDIDGNAVSSVTVPQVVIDAESELAGLLASDPTLANAANTGSNIASLQAGPVSITYHQPTTSAEAGATKLQPVIMDLLGPFLRGASADGTPAVYGFSDSTDAEFGECAQWTTTGPRV